MSGNTERNKAHIKGNTLTKRQNTWDNLVFINNLSLDVLQVIQNNLK